MATTNFKIFAESATDVMSDAEYEASTQRTGGVVPGIAESSMHNKLYKQATIMGAAIAQVLAERGFDALDTNYTGLVAALKQAFVGSLNNVKADTDGNVNYTLLSISDVYPVGAVMITTDNVNPGTRAAFSGTTWTTFGSGRVLMGAGTGTDTRGESKSFTGGATGGEYNHQLATDELASHSHSASSNWAGDHRHNRGTMNITGYDYWPKSDAGYGNDAGGAFYKSSTRFGNRRCDDCASQTVPYHEFDASRSWTGETSTAGGHSHTITVNATGSNSAHNNIQPYITVYFWKRTA